MFILFSVLLQTFTKNCFLWFNFWWMFLTEHAWVMGVELIWIPILWVYIWWNIQVRISSLNSVIYMILQHVYFYNHQTIFYSPSFSIPGTLRKCLYCLRTYVTTYLELYCYNISNPMLANKMWASLDFGVLTQLCVHSELVQHAKVETFPHVYGYIELLFIVKLYFSCSYGT